MRLTNYLREAFVNAAMNDVPHVDYQEQWRKLVLPAHVATLPTEVQTLWNNLNTRKFLNTCYMQCPGSSMEVPCIDEYEYRRNLQPPPAVREEADKLTKAYTAQRESQANLRRMLESVALSCTTRKALAAALPEFEKYLPAEEAPMSRTVPALANVVAEFAKAGWPKERKVKREAATA